MNAASHKHTWALIREWRRSMDTYTERVCSECGLYAYRRQVGDRVDLSWGGGGNATLSGITVGGT